MRPFWLQWLRHPKEGIFVGAGLVPARLPANAEGRAGTLTVWDLAAGKPLRGLPFVGSPPPALLSADGRLLAFRDPDDPTYVKLWDTTSSHASRRPGRWRSGRRRWPSASDIPLERAILGCLS